VTTNPFVNLFNDKADQALYEELIHEAIQFNGVDAFYMPRRSQTQFDPLFGDDPSKMFTEAYPVEVFIETMDKFQGGELFSKFGLEIRKQAKFLISTRSFNATMPQGYGRPLEGDILWLPNFQAFLEIKYVEDEAMFYTFGENQTQNGLYGFSLVCEKWIMAEENIQTGIQEIDSRAREKVTAYAFIMQGGGSNTYIIGEAVTSAANSNVGATVVSWNKPNLTLTLSHIKGSINANVQLIGQNSNSRWFTSATFQPVRQDINLPISDNQQLANEGNVVLDFSETNPFGQPV
jgi:hypothetical protein